MRCCYDTGLPIESCPCVEHVTARAPRSFPVTDPHDDAPDGATIELNGHTYHRAGGTWYLHATPPSDDTEPM